MSKSYKRMNCIRERKVDEFVYGMRNGMLSVARDRKKKKMRVHKVGWSDLSKCADNVG